jgi:hypothetical protein
MLETESINQLEYTINTQVSDLNETALINLNTSDQNSPCHRIRTPEQIINNRNIAKKNYIKKRNLNKELTETVIF